MGEHFCWLRFNTNAVHNFTFHRIEELLRKSNFEQAFSSSESSDQFSFWLLSRGQGRWARLRSFGMVRHLIEGRRIGVPRIVCPTKTVNLILASGLARPTVLT